MVRIAHLSDLHMETSPETRMPGVRKALDEGARLVRHASPDFVIVSGDLTTYGSADPAQLRAAKEWLDSLGIPYLAVPGNHDLGANAKRGALFPDTEAFHLGGWLSTSFAQVFKQPPVVIHHVGPVRLIGLALRDGDPDGALADVQRELETSHQPTIIIGHYPLIPVQSEGILATFGSDDYIPRTVQSLTALIHAYRHVFLYAAGHVHAVSVLPLFRGVVQITAGGFGPGPSQWWLYTASDTDFTFESREGAGAPTFWDRHLKDPRITADYHRNLAHGPVGTIPYTLAPLLKEEDLR